MSAAFQKVPSQTSSEFGPFLDNLDPIVGELFESGAVNFSAIANALPDHSEINRGILVHLQEATINKICEFLKSGNFGDSRGSDKILAKLGIVGIGLPEELRASLNTLLPRIDEGTLIELGLSQSGVVGKYNYERARAILERTGFLEDELDNSSLERILDYRHMLLALHRRRITQLDGGRHDLEAVQRLLQSGGV